jgi:hypothetical protein
LATIYPAGEFFVCNRADIYRCFCTKLYHAYNGARAPVRTYSSTYYAHFCSSICTCLCRIRTIVWPAPDIRLNKRFDDTAYRHACDKDHFRNPGKIIPFTLFIHHSVETIWSSLDREQVRSVVYIFINFGHSKTRSGAVNIRSASKQF